MPSNLVAAWHNYEKLDAVIDKYRPTVDAAMYSFKYEFALADYIMPRFGLKNLLQAAGAIFCCLCLFLPVRLALLCAVTVGCIDVLLLGAMVRRSAREARAERVRG